MKLKPFCSCTQILVVKGIVPVVEGLNIINVYAIYDPVTGPEHPIYVVICVQYEKLESFKMHYLPISKFCALKYTVLIFCILSKLT